MKNRLQALWNEVVPGSGPCPQPDARGVLRRVNAALDAEAPGHARLFRSLRKPAVVLAAVLLLFTGAAAASGQLPENNALDIFFGRGENPSAAALLVNTEAASVSDENYTMTVTSSLADENDVYFTFVIQARTEEAKAFLQSDLGNMGLAQDALFPGSSKKDAPLRFKVSWLWAGSWSFSCAGYEEETCSRQFSGSISLGPSLYRRVSLRFDAMEEGLWLTFPVKPVSSVTLPIHETGPGGGTMAHPDGGTVTLETVTLSPLSISAEYTTPVADAGQPTFFFLWKDGTVSTSGQLGVSGPPSGSSGMVENAYYTCHHSWQFDSVQDISQLEAVVCLDTAYPLDGSTPYPFDTSELPHPFSVPRGELTSGSYELPLFALCDGLGASYTWDEAAQTAVMTYRDVSVTVTAGDAVITLEGAEQETLSLRAAPVLRDGELWADASGQLRAVWQLLLYPAYRDLQETLRDGEVEQYPDTWLVIP